MYGIVMPAAYWRCLSDLAHLQPRCASAQLLDQQPEASRCVTAGMLLLLVTVAAAALATAQALDPPPPPPGCEGMHCRRERCGDVCTETDCSHFGNVCAGGAQAPAGPGWTYSSKFEAPALPSAFTSENATIFYYFNLLSKGQFVPQLTLGDGLCNGTGAPLYDCAPCTPNPKTSKQWYMQAQYFWEGHDPSGGPDLATPRFLGLRGRGAHVAAAATASMCHVIAGPLIPIEPGEMITTTFSMDEDSVWHASIGAGSKVSAIEVPYEYMERNQVRNLLSSHFLY